MELTDRVLAEVGCFNPVRVISVLLYNSPCYTPGVERVSARTGWSSVGMLVFPYAVYMSLV